MVVATGVEMLPPAGIKRLGRAHDLMNEEHRLVGSQTNDKSGGMRLLYPALCFSATLVTVSAAVVQW